MDNARAKTRLSADKYARLRAEAKSPYRGLRKFIYIGLGASGLIGLITFLAQLLAGQDPQQVLPNLALQLGVIVLMVWLFRREKA